MENPRRKERDNTSATVSEEDTLVVRTKLRLPLLREDVVARRCPSSSSGRAAARLE
jgi:hypothetical protein